MSDLTSSLSAGESPAGRTAPGTVKGGPGATLALDVGLLQLLSPREAEVLSYLALGMSNRQIGDQLGISHRTVEIHRAQVIAKLNVPNATQAAVLFDRAHRAEPVSV